MSDEAKTEEQKQAVASMRAAQKNMATAINRIEALERSLAAAANRLEDAAKHMPHAFGYNSTTRLCETFKGYAADARKEL